jgi:hypothetical protein
MKLEIKTLKENLAQAMGVANKLPNNSLLQEVYI